MMHKKVVFRKTIQKQYFRILIAKTFRVCLLRLFDIPCMEIYFEIDIEIFIAV